LMRPVSKMFVTARALRKQQKPISVDVGFGLHTRSQKLTRKPKHGIFVE